jgi:hypothetical protein
MVHHCMIKSVVMWLHTLGSVPVDVFDRCDIFLLAEQKHLQHLLSKLYTET